MNSENFYNLVSLFDGMASIVIDIGVIGTISVMSAWAFKDWLKGRKNGK